MCPFPRNYLAQNPSLTAVPSSAVDTATKGAKPVDRTPCSHALDPSQSHAHPMLRNLPNLPN
nr:hypothetical protein Q903MT_gene4700 [Picea sitchensis]